MDTRPTPGTAPELVAGERLDRLLQHAPTVILSADSSGLITLVLAGDQNAELRAWVGQNLYDLTGADVIAHEGVYATLNEGKETRRQFLWGGRVFRVTFYPRFDRGAVNGLDAVAADVTDEARFRSAFDGVIRLITEITALTDPYTQAHEESVAEIAGAIAPESDYLVQQSKAYASPHSCMTRARLPFLWSSCLDLASCNQLSLS